MADKYSPKYGKNKKKKRAFNKPEAEPSGVYPIVSATAKPEPTVVSKTAAEARPAARPAVMPDLTAELKRVGIIGGIMLAVLVAAGLIIG